jgi:hypothetical protein
MRFLTGLVIVAAVCGACSSSSGNGTTGSPTSSSSSSGSGSGGSGGGGTGGGDAGTDAPVNMCSAAIAQLLSPINKVSKGSVSILSTSGAVRTVYVDASAGGFGNDGSNPYIYLDLETATQVDLTDQQAETSTAWDLAVKRPVLFTNDGDGGLGKGGTHVVSKAFDAVTTADATGTFATESFVDSDCNPKTDDTGAVLTTLSDWYDYDQQTNVLTPKASTTYVIRGATGKLYKLGILTYYAEPDGGMGTLGGYYTFQIGAL